MDYVLVALQVIVEVVRFALTCLSLEEKGQESSAYKGDVIN